MKITLKLYATLGQYLPSGAEKNAVQLEVVDGSTPETVLDACHIPAQMVHLVLVNGLYVAAEDRASQVLQENDTLAIWPPVAGG